MAQSIRFNIAADVDMSELNSLIKSLNSVTDKLEKLDGIDPQIINPNQIRDIRRMDKEVSKVTDTMTSWRAANIRTEEQAQSMGRQIKISMDSMSRSTRLGLRNVEELSTAMTFLRQDISRINQVTNKLKYFPDDQKKAAEEAAKAVERVRIAEERLNKLRASGKSNTDEYKKISRELNAAAKDLDRAAANVDKLDKEFGQLTKTIHTTETLFKQVRAEAIKAGATEIELDEEFQDLIVALKSARSVMDAFGRETIRVQSTLSRNADGYKRTAAEAREYTEEMQKAVRETERLIRATTRDVNARGQLSAATKAITTQRQEYVKLTTAVQRTNDAADILTNVEKNVAAMMNRGTTSIKEQVMMTSRLREAREQLNTSKSSLRSQDTRLAAQMEAYAIAIDKAKAGLRELGALSGTMQKGSTEWVRNQEDIKALGAAYRELRTAQNSIVSNQTQVRTSLRQVGNELNRLDETTANYKQSLNEIKAMRSVWETMLAPIRNIINVAKQLADMFGKTVTAAINVAVRAMRGISRSAGAVFSGLQRALQGTGSAFNRFGNMVQNSMNRAKESMLAVTASGYALMSIGSQMQMFGNMTFRRMGSQLDQYVEYERSRIQAAIAATEMSPQGDMTVNNALLDRIIFDLQRGSSEYTPDWQRRETGVVPVTFSANELAQGMYYYSAAVGQEITEANAQVLIPTISTIMQMARVTNTGLESAIKGVMNIALEFGYDPRADEGQAGYIAQQDMQRITAQVGYLANISTMEVEDIVQMFKMVGPMANQIVGGGKGAGLDDTMLLAFMASEVGLRGGQVGRGVQQLFTSLLDPTNKMLGVMGKYFNEGGEAFTAAEFKDRFFEDGALKSYGDSPQEQGILGFFTQLASRGLKGADMATMVAEMFTNNATRAALGPLIGLDNEKIAGMDWEDFFAGWEENPLRWLAQASAETANSVSGWLDYMKNAWFQFTASIINSIKGPLTGGFRIIGELLFELASFITDTPAVGKFVAAFVSIISALASIGGTAVIAAGALMILSRTILSLGGGLAMFVRFMGLGALSLGIIIPFVLALAVGISVLSKLWQRDVLGMKTRWEAFSDSLFKGSEYGKMFAGLSTSVGRFGQVFDRFIEGAIFGNQKALAEFYGWMEKAFGPKFAALFLNSIAKINPAITDLGNKLKALVPMYRAGAASLGDYATAFRGFWESVIFGSMSTDAMVAVGRISEAFGLNVWEVLDSLEQAADGVRNFISIVYSAGAEIVGIWRGISEEIYNNLARAFNISSMSDLMSRLGGLASGFASGFGAAIAGVLRVIELITGGLAKLAVSFRVTSQAAHNLGKTVAGSVTTASGPLTRLRGLVIDLGISFEQVGMIIGAVLGARLALAFAPVMGIVRLLIPMMFSLSGVVAGLAGRLVTLAISFGIMVAQAAGYLVVGAALIAQKSLEAAQWLITTGLKQADTLSTIAQTAATIVATGATAAFTTSLTALWAVISMVAGIVFIVIGALLGLAAIMSVVAVAMLAATAYTEGWRAAWEGLVELIQGIITGFMAIVGPLMLVVMFIGRLVGAVSEFIGLGSSFAAVGLAIGLALGAILVIIGLLIVAVMALAAAWLVAWAIKLAPVLLLIALIGSLVYVLYQLVQDVMEVAGRITSAFEGMGDSIKIVFAKMMDSIGDSFRNFVNDVIIKGLNEIIKGVASSPMFSYLPFEVGDVIPEWTGEDGKRVQKVMEGIEYERRVAYMERVGSLEAYDVAPVDTSDSFLGSLVEKAGLSDFFISVGIDVDNMSLDDITKVTDKLFSLEELDIDLEGIDPDVWLMSPEEIEKHTEAWRYYTDEIERLKELGYTSHEAEIMAASGLKDIYGITPGEINQQAASIGNAIGQGADEIENAFADMQKRWEEGVQGWTEMSTPDLFGALYDPLAGQGQKSFVSWVSEYGWDAISKNIPEGTGSWLNETEFMADFALGGGMSAAGEGVYGQNLHTLLKDSGALDALSVQTGVPVEVLLEGVPKFTAPEKFHAAATVDMVNMIDGLRSVGGVDVATWFDTVFGTDFMTTSGEYATQFGGDWAELNNYAIGKALANQDWNLVDYISESWDISRQEAQDYLDTHGIDADSISSSWYESTKNAVLSNQGAYNVLSQEMFEWLQQFSDDVITMTEAEFMAMDDATKAILTRMGYTFVINDYVPLEALNKAREDVKALRKTLEDAVTQAENTEGGTWNFKGPDLNMDGMIEDWAVVGRHFDEEKQKWMVIVEDINGTQMSLPEVEYENYMSSLNTVTNGTIAWAQNFQGVVQDAIRNNPLDPLGMLFDIRDNAGNPSEGYGHAALGVPPAITTQVKFEVVDIPDVDLSSAIGVPITDGAGTLKITMETEGFSEAQEIAQSIQKDLEAIATTPVNVKINIDTVGMPATSMPDVQGPPAPGTGDGVGAGISIPVTADLTAFNTAIGDLTTRLSLSENPMQLKIGADLSQANQEIGELVSRLALSENPVKIKIGADLTSAVTDVSTFTTALNTAKYTINVELKGDLTIDNKISYMLGRLEELAITWTATISQIGADTAATSIGNVTGVATAMAKPWIATVTVLGTATASSMIQNVIDKATEVSKTWFVSVSVLVYGAHTITNLKNALDGLPTTKNVTVNTYRNEYVSRSGGGGILTKATGGRIGSAGSLGSVGMRLGQNDRYTGQYAALANQAASLPSGLTLVGEAGPELVGLSNGSYVMNAHQTASLFRESQQGSGNPLLLASTQASQGDVTINNENRTELHFHGDMHFGSEASAREFFDQIDRRSGREFDLAKRGMRPVSERIT